MLIVFENNKNQGRFSKPRSYKSDEVNDTGGVSAPLNELNVFELLYLFKIKIEVIPILIKKLFF